MNANSPFQAEPEQPEDQLSSALEYLSLALIEKCVVIDELQASNQELGAILDRLLSVRDDLREVTVYDDFSLISNSNGARGTPEYLDLAQLKREGDSILKRGQFIVQESMLLRMRSEKVRAMLVLPVDGHSKSPRREDDPLSKRERQVMTLLVAGKTSKRIAIELGISFKTAVTHRASIMGKLNVHEIASLVREAIRRGLV